jgi:lipoate-protein ligase A
MKFSTTEWRLLITPPSPGAWNMAVDEAILEAVDQEAVLPTLRFYAWEPPCLSIGYAQPISDVDTNRLQLLGWHLVRRLTGGRAILHTDELTYSVISPLSDPRLSGGVLESYRHLSAALLTALHIMKIPAESLPNPQVDTNSSKAAICFEVPSNYEITVFKKKIIGSAQARKRKMLLQHGSFPLWGDLTRITQVLNYHDDHQRDDAAIRLLEHATTVESILGNKIAWQDAVQAMITGFESELNLKLTRDELSSLELERVNTLMVNKYSHPSWLKRI